MSPLDSKALKLMTMCFLVDSLLVCLVSVPEGGSSDVSEGVADRGLVQRRGTVL